MASPSIAAHNIENKRQVCQTSSAITQHSDMLTFNPLHLVSEALGRQKVIAKFLEAVGFSEPHALLLECLQ